MPERREQSYGLIPIYQSNDSVQLLLVQHCAGHWGFPKGHAESGESKFAAARREFEEETGIRHYTAKRQPSFSEHYVCVKDGREVSKTVDYFLARVYSKDLSLQAEEIQHAQWVSPEAADELLSFKASRDLLKTILPAIQAQLDA